MKGEGQALVQIQNDFIRRPKVVTTNLNDTTTDSSIKSTAEIDDNDTTKSYSAYELQAHIQQENRSLVLSSCVRYIHFIFF